MLADGCAVRIVGEETFRIAREWVDEIVTVSNDEICAAVKEVFEDCRAVVEPAGALSYAGLKAWSNRESAQGLSLVAVLSGANLNFERLRYIAERAEVGEGHEGILAIEIPERPGSFRALCADMGARNLTEFNYRMGDSRAATVFAGVQIRSTRELDELVAILRAKGYRTVDLTADEVAKTHVRHMVGGRSPDAEHERLLHFDFPERAGALSTFLDRLGTRWNISLFHYRNHGSDVGRALVGIQVPPESETDFERFLAGVEYGWSDESSNPAIRMFLGG
jgi:threonine dehydratase